jgi:hypothetical protein
MIVLDIDVTKLDKARFREGKNGQKYCDLVLIDYPKEKSDGFVKQGVSKAEREARVEMPIIGNWRRVGQQQPQRPASRPAQQQPVEMESDDDIPF